MSLFVLDTTGNKDLLSQSSHNLKQVGKDVKKRKLLDEKVKTSTAFEAVAAALSNDDEDSEDDGDYFGLPPPSVDLSKIINKALEQAAIKPKSKVEEEMDYFSEQVATVGKRPKSRKKQLQRGDRITELNHSGFNELTGKFDDPQNLSKTDVDKEMTKSEMVPGLEKLKELPSITKKKQRQLNRIERSKTKGAGWYNLPATEKTEEIANDLKILQMRSVLNPKHFYKKNDLKVLPKYFQIGTVQHSPLDYYSERDTRRNKKKSLVEEILADADAQKYTKRKYNEIVARKNKYAHKNAMQKMKKLKKNKK